MAIVTPGGLRIRLPIEHSFALISRLHPRASGYEVLKTADDFKELPATAAFIAALVCFYFAVGPLATAGVVFTVSALVFSASRAGLPIGKVPVRLASIYNRLSSFGILYPAFGILALYWADWRALLAFIAARILSTVLTSAFEKLRDGSPGEARILGGPERIFMNSYRLHARRLGVTTDTAVLADELEEEKWRPAYRDLASRMPELVAGFTDE